MLRPPWAARRRHRKSVGTPPRRPPMERDSETSRLPTPGRRDSETGPWWTRHRPDRRGSGVPSRRQDTAPFTVGRREPHAVTRAEEGIHGPTGHVEVAPCVVSRAGGGGARRVLGFGRDGVERLASAGGTAWSPTTSSWETSGTSGLQPGWVSFTLETREGDGDHSLALLRLKGDATVGRGRSGRGPRGLLGAGRADRGRGRGHRGGVALGDRPTWIRDRTRSIDFGETEEGPNFSRG